MLRFDHSLPSDIGVARIVTGHSSRSIINHSTSVSDASSYNCKKLKRAFNASRFNHSMRQPVYMSRAGLLCRLPVVPVKYGRIVLSKA